MVVDVKDFKEEMHAPTRFAIVTDSEIDEFVTNNGKLKHQEKYRFGQCACSSTGEMKRIAEYRNLWKWRANNWIFMYHFVVCVVSKRNYCTDGVHYCTNFPASEVILQCSSAPSSITFNFCSLFIIGMGGAKLNRMVAISFCYFPTSVDIGRKLCL